MFEILEQHPALVVIALVFATILTAFTHHLFSVAHKTHGRRRDYEAGRRADDQAREDELAALKALQAQRARTAQHEFDQRVADRAFGDVANRHPAYVEEAPGRRMEDQYVGTREQVDLWKDQVH